MVSSTGHCGRSTKQRMTPTKASACVCPMPLTHKLLFRTRAAVALESSTPDSSRAEFLDHRRPHSWARCLACSTIHANTGFDPSNLITNRRSNQRLNRQQLQYVAAPEPTVFNKVCLPTCLDLFLIVVQCWVAKTHRTIMSGCDAKDKRHNAGGPTCMTHTPHEYTQHCMSHISRQTMLSSQPVS